MRKLIKYTLFILLFSLISVTNVFANGAIDITKADKGIVTVKYSGDLSKGIKIVVKKDGGDQYPYTLKSNDVSIVPLQMGTGKYTVTLFEGIGGNKYKPLQSEAVSVNQIDEKAMYTSSSIIVDFVASKDAIPYYKNLTSSKEGNVKIDTIYDDVVKNYSYDYDKAKNMPKEYIPVIDNMYKVKKGICYDYAAIFAGSLRSQGIPTKLIMGYAPEITEYHAWCEVLIDGKWVTVDTTYDSQMNKNKAKFTFAKDGSKYKVVKVY